LKRKWKKRVRSGVERRMGKVEKKKAHCLEAVGLWG